MAVFLCEAYAVASSSVCLHSFILEDEAPTYIFHKGFLCSTVQFVIVTMLKAVGYRYWQ